MMKCRNFIIQNFMVNVICTVDVNNNYYFNTCIVRTTLRLIPFYIIKYIASLLKIKVIYIIDNIYYIEPIKQNHILPIIMNFEFIKENQDSCNVTDKIKFYNSSLPISFFIKQHNLESYKAIKLKYLKKGKLIDKIVEINNINCLIYNLFDD